MGDATLTLILTPIAMEHRAVAAAVSHVPFTRVHLIGIKARRLPQVQPGSRVIVAGLAGALDPALKVGDLIVDGLDLPDPGWHLGRIHTAADVVATPADKAALFQETGALAVDMEQAIVARSLPPGVSLIGVRAISDTAHTSVDPAVLNLVDDFGRPRPLAVAGTLIRRPNIVPHLRQLQADANVALDRLTVALLFLLDRFPPGPAVAYAPPDSP